MKLTPWCIAAIAPIAVASCSGTVLGQVAVLAVTVGIFCGTLSLGRVTATNAAPQASLDGAPPALTPLPRPSLAGPASSPEDGRTALG